MLCKTSLLLQSTKAPLSRARGRGAISLQCVLLKTRCSDPCTIVQTLHLAVSDVLCLSKGSWTLAKLQGLQEVCRTSGIPHWTRPGFAR